MAQQVVNIGSAPSDGSGDAIRVSFNKINQNFTELYTYVTGIDSNISAALSPVISVAGKTGQVQLGVGDIIGGVNAAYVDNKVLEQVNIAIAQLIDAAPASLDTLRELANAVANNPDFSIEVFGQLATKANASTVYTKAEVDTLLLNITSSNTHPPTSAIGVAGDVAGLTSIDASFLYYCVGTYDGISNIWTRTPLSSTW
jgi:hypothetical protein